MRRRTFLGTALSRLSQHLVMSSDNEAGAVRRLDFDGNKLFIDNNEKNLPDQKDGDDLSTDDTESEVLTDARDLVTHVISVEDDPGLNPWTFRVLVIGIGLSAFGGVLGALQYIS